jgi:hypothetical protein
MPIITMPGPRKLVQLRQRNGFGSGSSASVHGGIADDVTGLCAQAAACTCDDAVMMVAPPFVNRLHRGVPGAVTIFPRCDCRT